MTHLFYLFSNFMTHLLYLFSNFMTHLQYLFSNFMTHLLYLLSIFVTHLLYLFSNFMTHLLYLLSIFMTHLLCLLKEVGQFIHQKLSQTSYNHSYSGRCLVVKEFIMAFKQTFCSWTNFVRKMIVRINGECQLRPILETRKSWVTFMPCLEA